MILVKISTREIGNLLIQLLVPLTMLRLKFRENVFFMLCSGLHINCWLVVHGCDSFWNVGGISSLCLWNSQIDLVQNTKLEKIPCHSPWCKGKHTSSWPHQVSSILFRKLVADPKDRLGVNGVEEIKAHPFFTGVNWQKLRYFLNNEEKRSHHISLRWKIVGILRILITTMKNSLGTLPSKNHKKAKRKIPNLSDTPTNQCSNPTPPW